MAKFILSVIAIFSICMPAAAQTNMQTTPLQRPQQEPMFAQQPDQAARTGLSRDQIREVQRELLRQGYYSAPADGIFGPKTERALREFQKDRQLPVTGQIGGLSRDQIREVQRALLRNGYDAGPEDGSFGPWTARALRQFQKAQQLPVTGQLDDRSLAALQIGQGEVGGEKSIGPKEIPTPTSPSTPQETSGQRSPDGQSNTLNQKSNAPEESIGGEGAKRSWWRSLWERLWGR